jgi:glyoxylase-like metal-dependent hydrolase (beta-lactamase superfamily II)
MAAGATSARSSGSLLPPQLHVFVRDWLSSNNIVLKSGSGHVVIDAGYHVHAQHTLQLLRTQWGIGDAPLSLLVNTHCHSDHIGGNAAIREAYGCPIWIPAGEAHLVDPWDSDGLWLGYADQFAPQFSFDALIAPGDVNTWGDLEWEALAAPGHDMGALMFWNPQHRILITGDALWANGFGFVSPAEIDPRCIPAARATLELIGTLDVAVVIPGHGEPFTDCAGALRRAEGKLAALAEDPARNARHILKVMLVFALLAGRRLRRDEVPAYVESVPVFRDFNRRFLQREPQALAELLVSELEQGGALRRDGEYLAAR